MWLEDLHGDVEDLHGDMEDLHGDMEDLHEDVEASRLPATIRFLNSFPIARAPSGQRSRL